MNEIKRSGFVAIVGRPNVGKSTLLNRLMGEKISIVSKKPQTTRTKVTAILNSGDTQIVFLDTPGFFKPKNKLGEYMAGVVNNSILDVDAAVLVVEPKEPGNTEKEMIGKIKEAGMKGILVINKTDTVKKEELLPLIAKYSTLFDFEEIIPLSALNDKDVKILENAIKALMKEGPAYYPDDVFTDQTERQIACEVIREKLLRVLDDEVPHGTAVEVLSMKEGENGVLNISANIYCEKESHKGIIIGKSGAMLKKIGTYAREDLETFFGVKVFLQIWVKVKDDWRNNDFLLKEFGFNA